MTATDLNKPPLAAETEILYLEGWAIQPLLNRAVKDAKEVRFEPRLMQVLTYLLKAAGEPVTRDELMKNVWGHEFVTDDALNRSVSRLRRVISEDLQCTASIEAIPKTGYQLVPGNMQASLTSPATIATAAPGRKKLIFAVIALCIALPIFVGYIMWYGMRSKNPELGSAGNFRVTPVISLQGNEIDPTLSPDGSEIAFAWRKTLDAPYHIYMRTLSSEALLQLSDGPANDVRPVWSPSGGIVAFLRIEDTHCNVMTVSSAGGPAKQIAECNADDGDALAWTADGQSLVFKRPRSTALSIYSIATDTSQRLTDVPSSELDDSSPACSPDGMWVAFVRWHARGVADLYLIPLKGGVSRQLTFDNLWMHTPAWEPDSRHIVYASNRDGPFSLWQIDIRSPIPIHLPAVSHTAGAIAISRDGKELVYEEWLAQTNLFESHLARGSKSETQITYTTRLDWSPAISPNGKKIAFVSDRSGPYQIWIADRNGENAESITNFGGVYTGNPAWSPDGALLAFDSAARSGHFDIYTVRTGGSGVRQLTSSVADNRYPQFSSDGRWVYFSSRRTRSWNIWRIPTSGGSEEQVTFDGAYFSQIGPDGSVYFSKDDQPGIWRSKPGASPILVVNDFTLFPDPAWRLSGGKIWYLRRGTGNGFSLIMHGLDPGGTEIEVTKLSSVSTQSGIAVEANRAVIFPRVMNLETNIVLLQRD